jgi:hypothetical protein
MTPAQMERMALWAVVLILIVVVVFAQRRSSFTPSTGAPISLMDLHEYSSLSEKQKMDYKTELSRKLTELGSLSAAGNFTNYTTQLNDIMSSVFTPQSVITTTTPQMPPPPPAMPQAPGAPPPPAM